MQVAGDALALRGELLLRLHPFDEAVDFELKDVHGADDGDDQDEADNRAIDGGRNAGVDEEQALVNDVGGEEVAALDEDAAEHRVGDHSHAGKAEHVVDVVES
jgi:hypothetical protein